MGEAGVELFVEDRVDCAECQERYDSAKHAFCPRCGSLKQGTPVPGAIPAARRFDPRRRRVQLVGVSLTAIGLIAVLAFANVILNPPSADDASLEMLAASPLANAGPGGVLTLTLHNGTEPVADAPIAVTLWNGSHHATVQTDATGEARIPLPQPFVNVTGPGFERMVYVPAGNMMAVPIDTNETQQADWIAHPITTQMRTIGSFLLFFALVIVAGGVAAIMVRAFALAMTSAVTVTAFWGLLALAAPSAWTLLLLLAFIVMTTMLGRGKRCFGKPREA